MLIFHIITATLGVVGSYVWGIPFLTKKSSDRIVQIGTRLTLFALAGVLVSGIALFAQNPEVFLGSGKFLSNMTILGVLILIEGSYFLPQTKRTKTLGRLLSMYSWSWIFIAALLHPSYSYSYFMSAYAGVLLLIVVCARLKAD